MVPSRDRASARTAWAVVVGCIAFAIAWLFLHFELPRSFLIFFGGIFSVMGALVGALVAVILSRTADRYERLVNGEGRLVEWLVDDEAWRRFRTLDGEASLKGANVARWMTYGVGGIFAAAAGVVWVDDPKAWELSILFVLLGAGFAWFGWMLQRNVRRFALAEESPSAAHLGRDGLAFRGRFVPFRGFGLRFVRATVDPDHDVLHVTYEVSDADTQAEHQVRVPFPASKRDEARRVSELLG